METNQQDKEIQSMLNAYNELKDLSEEEKIRALSWLTSKLGLNGKVKQNINYKPLETSNNNFSSFDSVVDLFAAANVQKDQEKVLLAAAYLQLKQNLTDITSLEINKELKNMGHKVGNITATISGLINKSPQLMIQTRKEGKSMQAQKKYKVTTEGINTAKTFLINTESAIN